MISEGLQVSCLRARSLLMHSLSLTRSLSQTRNGNKHFGLYSFLIIISEHGYAHVIRPHYGPIQGRTENSTSRDRLSDSKGFQTWTIEIVCRISMHLLWMFTGQLLPLFGINTEGVV
jgi:hypothetical protein